MDRRTTPANARVAAAELQGVVAAAAYVTGTPSFVAVSVADLLKAPDGPRDRQLLYGAKVRVLEDHEGWSFVQASDGYVGYVASAALDANAAAPTHRIIACATHAYERPDFKSPDRLSLPFGAAVAVGRIEDRYAETPLGYIPVVHLGPIAHCFSDPVEVARLHLGTPYLWGGNSAFGLDCSGLVQASLLACGIPCPGDSDMQSAEVGEPIAKDEPLQRGDLIFWKGHVAMMTGPDRMIHANATHMAVVEEDFAEACARIAAKGDGAIIARRRP
jgi:cell wall-associated NlpC family hydrolase